jgi:hypothetical protein
VSALALRDLMLIRKERSAWIVVLMALVLPFLMLGKSALAIAFMALPAYYVAAWACGMDFKYRSDRFLCSLPLSRAAIVRHRFAGPLVTWAASFALTALVWTALAALGAGLTMAGLAAAAFLSLAATMIVVGMYLASYYAFGYQNARWAIFVFIGLGGAFAGALGSNRTASAGKASPTGALGALLSGDAGIGLYIAAVLAALAAYAASYMIAIAAYRKKQF